jgi:hypothetical protein
MSHSSPAATPHSTHDLVLLAAAADRDPDRGLRAAADAQIAGCADCAAVALELRGLSAGLASLPRSRPVPRDMRLSADQAARLRRGSSWRRILRPFGAEGLPGLRPLAAALTTFGLAGLLLTSMPLGPGSAGSSALAPISGDVNGQAGEAYSRGPAPAAASAAAIDGGSKDLASSTPAMAASGGPSSGHDDTSPTAPGSATTGTAEAGGPRIAPLTLVSLALAVAGMGLFAVLLIARRVG